MSFLTPLYIAGVLSVTLPILFHFIRRSPRDRMPFSSLMFLRQSPPRITRRSRLENLLLLMLRVTALTLLAVAFARPFLRNPRLADADSGAGRVLAVLVDTSASMRRTGLWEAAAAQVQHVLDDMQPMDHVTVMTFDRQIQPVVSFDQWAETPATARSATVRDRLARLEPTWNATHLGAALGAAADAVDSHAEQLSGHGVPEQRVVLISDLQRGSELGGLRQYEWPDPVRLEVRAVAANSHTNASIQLVLEREDTSAPANPTRARISNAGDSDRSRFQVHWGDAPDTPLDIYVAPGTSRVLEVPALPAAHASDHLVVEGDDHGFDNRAYVIARQTEIVPVVFLGRGAADDPKLLRYYFERAFPDSRWRSIQVRASRPSDPLTANEMVGVRLVVVADSVPDDTVGILREFVHDGGTVLCVLTDSTVARSLGQMIGRDDWSDGDAAVRDYAMLGELDFMHPLLAPFSDPRYGDFTKIHFWRHRHIDETRLDAARVIARFDDRDPALIELRRDHGQVLVLTAGWHPDDSQLAVSSKFVPLLHSILDYAAGPAVSAAQYRVGDVIVLPEPDGAARQVRMPDGSEISMGPGTREFRDTIQPGLYTILGTATPGRFAVNLDPTESDTAPLPVEELEQLGVYLTGTTRSMSIETEAAARRQMLAFELEARQKLWRWLVVAALAVLLMETWLAGFMARRMSM